ncbi:MAG: ATP-binding protein [Candidatus Neomarinimicrobiota bacterium]
MEKTKIFSSAQDRIEILRVYHDWLFVNKLLWSKYYSVLAMLFMAILIPFDFILFDPPNDIFFTRFRVISIIIFGLNLYLLSIKSPPKQEEAVKAKFSVLMILPGFLFCSMYEYFLIQTQGAVYSTVFVANFLLIFFVTFFMHRFWKEQYVLTFLLITGLVIVSIFRNDIISDLILILIGIISSTIIAFFFRREFVGTMYLRFRNRELQAAKERAETSDQIKSVFLSTMSHELRTPLNVIFGYTDLLQMSMEDRLTEEEEGFISNINTGKERLMKLIDEIMDISRIEAGRYALKIEELSGDEILENITETTRTVCEKKGLEFDKNLNGSGAVIIADSTRFTQLLNILLDNAVKFTEKGSVKVSSGVKKGEYWVSIQDTGIGIREEFKPHLFETFRQAEEGFSRTYEGAGLGLAIAKQFVEEMQGTIEFDSKEGQGSTFVVYFPTEISSREKQDQVPEQTWTRPSGKEKKSRVTDKKNMNILLLEDNLANLKYLENILDRLDYNYFSETSAEEALNRMDTTTISGALVDISLADQMDGFDFLKRVRDTDQYRDIPMIAITAHKTPGIEEECYEKGFDEFLAKPFTLESLRDILERNF